VVGEAHEAAARGEECQDLLAAREAELAQVAPGGAQQVEGEEDHGDLGPGTLCERGIALREAALDALEGAAPALVERGDLAVENEFRHGKLSEGADDLGVEGGALTPAAREDADLPGALLAEHAHAVVLELEEPALA
jgi:hypothetical protein